MGIVAAVIVMFLFVCVVSTLVGIRLLKSAARRPEDNADVAPARVANPHGSDRAYVKLVTGATRVTRGVKRVVGIVLILAPWAAIVAIWQACNSFSHDSYSKGRVLRIRNRARLPEPALGDGWGDAVVLHGALTDAERSVLGELWLLTARMEHASIAAFSQLSLHLSALGAPARLLAASHRAALDEIRHAERCYAIASAITGTRQAAGPIAELAHAHGGSIDLTRLAIGSLVDGCLAEGMAADVAARGARTAEEPTIRATLTMIAREEIGHAELAWDVLAWCLERGGADVRDAVAQRVDALAREVAPRMPAIPGVDDAALARHGVVDQDALGDIAHARLAAVQDRARALLATDVRAAA